MVLAVHPHRLDAKSASLRCIDVSVRRFAGPIAVAAAFVALAAVSWRRWPHPIVDYGIALEMARELARGKVLYRDIAHMQGGLSPYLNSLVFRAFGDSFASLFEFHLVLLAGIAALVYALVGRACGRLAAT